MLDNLIYKVIVWVYSLRFILEKISTLNPLAVLQQKQESLPHKHELLKLCQVKEL